MTKAPISLQDLRRRVYVKAKADSAGSGGVGDRWIAESGSRAIRLITLDEKCAGKRSAGNPLAAFEVAGAGNGSMEGILRHSPGKPGVNG